MPVTEHLKRIGRNGLPRPSEPVKDQPLLLRPCSQPGFTEPTPLDVAGALLPHPCTLTCGPMAPSAVCFCGTLLTVTRTGRYPASLVFREPGLSSDPTGIRSRLAPSSLL